MNRNKNLYAYPFKELEKFLDTGINTKLEIFYNSFKNEFFSHRIHTIDRENNTIKLYKDNYSENESPLATFLFETEIKPIFLKLIYKSLDIISEGINICFISQQSIPSYFNKIERQLKTLKNNKQLNKYPFLNNLLIVIDDELNNYKTSDNIRKENENYKFSPFKPKDFIKRSFFHKLYDVCISNELIDDDYPREDFIDIFTSPSTKKNLLFKCNNQLIVTLFEGINPMFENLKQVSMDKTKRFLTKQNKVFSTTTYSSTKKRLTINPSITKLEEDLNDLVSTQE